MWPGGTGTIPSNMSGTTLLADAGGDDHSLMHREIGTILNSLPTTFGSTSGTNLLRGVVNASDQLFALNSGGTADQTITKGTANNMIMGSQTATGGTFNNPVIGTMNATGGTIASVVGTQTGNNLMANWLGASNGTSINVGSAAAPTAGQVLVATNGSAATWKSSIAFATTGSIASATTTSASLVPIPNGTIIINPAGNVTVDIVAKGASSNNASSNPEHVVQLNGTTIDYIANNWVQANNNIPWTLAGQGTMAAGAGTIVLLHDNGGAGTATSVYSNMRVMWG